MFFPTVTLLTHLQECITDITLEWKKTGFPVLLLGTTSEAGSIPVGLSSCFKHELGFEVSVSSPSASVKTLSGSDRHLAKQNDTNSSNAYFMTPV